MGARRWKKTLFIINSLHHKEHFTQYIQAAYVLLFNLQIP